MFGRNLFSRSVLRGAEIDLRLRESGMKDSACGIDDGFTYDICAHRHLTSLGYVSVRLGESPSLYYLGHVGYRVHENARGHGYAAIAVRMLIPSLRALGIRSLAITTDEDNQPSRVTCERLGCILERVAPVPPAYQPLCMMSRSKCRYILLLEREGGVMPG